MRHENKKLLLLSACVRKKIAFYHHLAFKINEQTSSSRKFNVVVSRINVTDLIDYKVVR